MVMVFLRIIFFSFSIKYCYSFSIKTYAVSPHKNHLKMLQHVKKCENEHVWVSFYVFLSFAKKNNFCDFCRVATVKGKYLENEIFSRSEKSQGILWMVREI